MFCVWEGKYKLYVWEGLGKITRFVIANLHYNSTPLESICAIGRFRAAAILKSKARLRWEETRM